jgi:hypothetical protein
MPISPGGGGGGGGGGTARGGAAGTPTFLDPRDGGGGGGGGGGPFDRGGAGGTPIVSSPGGGGGGGSGTPFGNDRSISTVSRFTLNPDSTRSLNTLRSSANGDPPETRGDFLPGDATQLGDLGDADAFASVSRPGESAAISSRAGEGVETVSGSGRVRTVNLDDPPS